MIFKDKLKRKLNNRLLDYSYKFRLARILALMPDSLDIELTNRCNLNCPGCPRGSMDRKIGDMSNKLFRRIIDSSYPYISFTWLHLFGEPLLNSNVADMISYASRNNIACGISTNATFLTENIAKKLCLSGLDTIIISIDAVTKNTYDELRPGGNFQKVVKNTEKFLNLPERKKIRHTIIQLVKMKRNRNEVDDFIKKWRGSDRNVHIKKEETWAGHFKKNSQEFPEARFPCRKLWQRLTIDWEGNVSICCRDFKMQIKLGNIENSSLRSIWNGLKMVTLRRALVKNNLNNVPLCKNCNEWLFSDGNHSNYIRY